MSASRLRGPGAALVALLVLAPRAAFACAVCTGAEKPNVSRALLRGSIVLSVLPPGAALGLTLWVRRRSRELARASASRDSAVAASRTA